MKKQILYICNSNPMVFPRSGGEQRTCALYKILCKQGDVWVFVWGGKNKTPIQLGPNVWQISTRNLGRAECLKALANKLYAMVFGWTEPSYLKKTKLFTAKLPVAQCFPGRTFDFVVVRYFHALKHFHPWKLGVPVYADLDDSPLEVYRTFYKPQLSRLKAILGEWRLAHQIRYFCNKCKGGWLSNAATITPLFDSSKFKLLANFPQLPPSDYHAENTDRKSLFFVGTFAYDPNRFGIQRFLSEMWPSIHDKFPQLKFDIVGGGLPQALKEAWERIPNVTVHGFVEDLAPYYSTAYASIVPIRAGSGMAIKTYESLAYSRPCLTTRFGIRGWPASESSPKQGFYIYETTEQCLEQIRIILNLCAEERVVMEKACAQLASRSASESAFESSVLSLL